MDRPAGCPRAPPGSHRLLDTLAGKWTGGDDCRPWFLGAGRPTLILAVLMAALMILTETLQGFIEWIKTAESELIQDHISALVHERSASLDMAFYESPDYYDRLYRARTDATTRPLALLESGGSLLQNGLTLLGMAVVLIPYGLWLPLVLVASTVPALYVVVKSNRRLHHWWEQSTTDRRWCQYHEWVLTSGSAAAEIRLFGLGDDSRSSYKEIRARMRGEHLQLVRDQALVRLMAGTAALLVSGGAMGWMVWQTMRGLLTMGDLVLFYQAFKQGTVSNAISTGKYRTDLQQYPVSGQSF